MNLAVATASPPARISELRRCSHRSNTPHVLALWDAIGITHELNGYRNDAAGWLKKYGDERELQIGAFSAIEGVKKALEKKVNDGWDHVAKNTANMSNPKGHALGLLPALTNMVALLSRPRTMHPRSAWLIPRRTQLREFALSLLAANCLLWSHTGQASTSTTSTYRLANIDVKETADTLIFHAEGRRLASVRVMPGGDLRPEVHLNASGILSIGTQRFDTKTGRVMDPRHITPCESKLMKRANSMLRTSATTALLLIRRDDASGRTMAYDSQAYVLSGCRLIARQRLSGSQLDLFFEFGSTAHGAWLVGSDERFLLIRPHGSTWRRLSLPEQWGNLLTAQWRSDGAMWVLVNVLQDGAITPTLFRSIDHGRQWQRMGTTVDQVPDNWFEATRELSKAVD